eukprot:1611762-Amphidinium_carterae.1
MGENRASPTWKSQVPHRGWCELPVFVHLVVAKPPSRTEIAQRDVQVGVGLKGGRMNTHAAVSRTLEAALMLSSTAQGILAMLMN